jgi:S1-C subfamily serine protease
VRVIASPLVFSCLLGAFGCAARQPAAPAEPTRAEVARAALRTPAEIAARSTPSVVSVRTEQSLGTGFVVSSDGLIATNLHVIAGNADITVTLSDHREFQVVEIWNGDRQRDLVIMRIQAKKLPVIPLGNSDAIRAGDSIVAIGHPLGLEDTVSNGLVSAVRKLDKGLTVLQISAPIAPGSSGGPIFNDHGEVIGVATAIMLGGQNINFGVPISYLKELLKKPAAVNLQTFAAATAERNAKTDSKRNIPALSIRILDGCSRGSIELMVKSLAAAIDIGAALYDDGNFAGSYHIYDGAASDLERKLGGSCQRPAKTLADGRKRAARLADPSDQAWAMRDTFDGLLDVIRRHGAQNGRPPPLPLPSAPKRDTPPRRKN